MRHCYLFNPENDLALASDSSHYHTPKKILEFSSNLSLLPVWYAPNNSLILTRTEVDSEWYQELFSQLGIQQQWLTIERYSYQPEDYLSPWGWNSALLTWWKELNPTFSICLEQIRNWSSRAVTINLLSYLKQQNLLEPSLTIPQKLNSYSDILRFQTEHPLFILKSPWSGSGKGLFWSNGLWRDKLREWSNNILTTQGFVIGELVYEKKHDFAMEFFCQDGNVSFIGYSHFLTDKFGHYKYNIMAADKEIESFLLQKLYHPERLLRTKEKIILFLKENLAQFYNGYLGIDMMLYGSKSTDCYLHPCIEINLRMNMGIVSRMIHNRYFSEETKGIYKVKTFSSPKELLDYDLFMRKKFPLKIESKKIMNGYLALTQITPHSRSLAYLQSGIEEEVCHV